MKDKPNHVNLGIFAIKQFYMSCILVGGTLLVNNCTKQLGGDVQYERV